MNDNESHTKDPHGEPEAQPQNRQRNRRRQLVVNKPMQSRIIMMMSWPAATALVLCAVMLGIFCSRLVDEAMTANVQLPSLVPVFMTVICFLVIAGLYLLFNAIKFSNRIAGPAYRLGKTLEAVQAGDLSARARLRDGDVLEELGDSVNTFLDWLEQHPPTGVTTAETEAVVADAEAAAAEATVEAENAIAEVEAVMSGATDGAEQPEKAGS